MTRLMWHRLYIVWLILCFPGSWIDGSEAGGPQERHAPEITVVTVADKGVLNVPPEIKGRDGGYSTRFRGLSVWVYGDTITGGEKGIGRRLYSNSWAWTRDDDASDGLGPFEHPTNPDGRPTPLLPFTGTERKFNDDHLFENCRIEPCGARLALWPGEIVADPSRQRMILFYEKVYVRPGDLNIYPIGHSLAVWKSLKRPPQRVRFNTDKNHPTLMFHIGEPGFGSAAVLMESMLYVYGCDRQGHRKPCRVARVNMGDVVIKDQWEIYSPDGNWDKDLTRGKVVFNGNGIMSVAFNPFLDRLVAVYSQPMSTAVMFRTAEHPEGPWSRPVEAFKAMASSSTHGWVYDAVEHPE